MKTEDLRKQYCNESKEEYIEFASLEELQHYVEWLENKLTLQRLDIEEFGKITEQDLKNAIKRIKQDKSEDERLKEDIEELTTKIKNEAERVGVLTKGQIIAYSHCWFELRNILDKK